MQLLCFALLILSMDLHNPRVKTKMSKREFVRSLRGVLDDDDVLTQLYDHVFLYGHIGEPRRPRGARQALARLVAA